jgi:hypothetical protein
VLNYASERAYVYDVSLTVFDDKEARIGSTRQQVSTDGETEIYEVLLPEPVLVECGRVYTVLVTLQCQPVARRYRGESGSTKVSVGYDSFNFFHSEKDDSNTGVTFGDIPGLLFR